MIISCFAHSVPRAFHASRSVPPLKNSLSLSLQCINTGPENFLWQKNCESIVSVAPGLYEVSCSFFTSHSPTVQLFVNGEPVLTASEASHSKIR